jgi:hypothetical protein
MNVRTRERERQSGCQQNMVLNSILVDDILYTLQTRLLSLVMFVPRRMTEWAEVELSSLEGVITENRMRIAVYHEKRRARQDNLLSMSYAMVKCNT